MIEDVFLTAIENTCRNIDEKRWGDVKDLEKFGIQKIKSKVSSEPVVIDKHENIPEKSNLPKILQKPNTFD